MVGASLAVSHDQKHYDCTKLVESYRMFSVTFIFLLLLFLGLLFNRLYNDSTSSCAHLTIILRMTPRISGSSNYEPAKRGVWQYK